MLIHFTKTIEALASITQTGFLYLHNETGILGPALQQALGFNCGDEQSNGMICFTELQPQNTHAHQKKYGEFGIGVSKEWLVKHGAKQVEYISVGSRKFNQYVTWVKRYAPKEINGKPITELLLDSESRLFAKQALSGRSSICNTYTQLIEKLSWTQIHIDQADLEWRLRNPKPYRFTGTPTRKQQVDLLVHCIYDTKVLDVCEGVTHYTIDCKTQLITTGKLSLVLPLPKEQIIAFFCPKSSHDAISKTIDSLGGGAISIHTI